MLTVPCHFLPLGRNNRRSLQRQEQDQLRKIIAEARVAAGLSQRELSRQLDMPVTFMARIERGERSVDVIEFIDIARMLGLSPSRLLAQVSPDLTQMES